MADSYITADYLSSKLGAGFVNAVDDLEAVNVGEICVDATAALQSILRKKGYEAPLTLDGVEARTAKTLRSATVWLAWTHLSQLPDSSVELPEKFTQNMYYLAFASITADPPTASLDLPTTPTGDPTAGLDLVGDRAI